MKKIILLVLVAAGLGFGAKGQTEYLVTVDPATGAFTKVNSIPGVMWIAVSPDFCTIESTNNRFIFMGSPPAGTPNYLYSLNNSNGDIISNPPFSGPIEGLLYGDSSKILYGIEGQNSRREFLVSVNSQTGSYTTVISTLNNDLFSIDEWTYNSNLNQLIIYGEDSSYNYQFFTVDGKTGDIISQIISNNAFKQFHFDNSTNELFGFQVISNIYQFGKINISSGQFSLLYMLPSGERLAGESGKGNLDEKDQDYIFQTEDTSNNTYLYLINVNSGRVVYKNKVEADPGISDNVIEYKYDNATNILYALHWEALTTPVTLVSFTTTKEATQNLLQWTTTQEINSSYFAVERSSDGVNFTSIGQVNAVGNSSATDKYAYTDMKPASGTNYYRLRMVDKDGKFSYSQVRSINEAVSFGVSIYPNPVQDKLNLNFNSDKAMAVQVEIINNEGKVITTQQMQVAAGVSTQSINTASLSNGAYYVRLISAEGETELKFVKE